MLGIFDFDGTLFDTHDAVYAAYADAGVEMPLDAWGKPWQEWLPGLAPPGAVPLPWAQGAHRTKNAAMARHLARVRSLPTLEELWRLVRSRQDIYIMTGASQEAVELVLSKYPALHNVLRTPRETDVRYYTSLTTSAKVEICRNIATAENHRQVAYYDDHEATCRDLRRECPDWVINHVI